MEILLKLMFKAVQLKYLQMLNPIFKAVFFSTHIIRKSVINLDLTIMGFLSVCYRHILMK